MRINFAKQKGFQTKTIQILGQFRDKKNQKKDKH